MDSIELSEEIYELLNGQDLMDKQHEAIMLLTVNEDGWPHTAMLSVGEITATGSGEIRIGLWKGTTSAGNLIRTGKATLVLFYRGKAIYIQISAQRMQELPSAAYPRERFRAHITSFREDTAKYADITSGVTIQLKDPVEVMARWSQTIEELRQ